MKNQTNKKPNPKKTQTGPSSLLIWESIILFIIASFAFLPDESANEVEVSYNTYKELLAENKIKEASIENDNSFHPIKQFDQNNLMVKRQQIRFFLQMMLHVY